MRIFSVPPAEEMLTEPSFYDPVSRIRLRQQVDAHPICKCVLCQAVDVISWTQISTALS